jgi:hypothetical protein
VRTLHAMDWVITWHCFAAVRPKPASFALVSPHPRRDRGGARDLVV